MVSTEILVQKRVLVGTMEKPNSLIPREWVCKKVDCLSVVGLVPVE
jgi:hypothetical protein